jgi:aminoglycoside phosphotransferase (APT) family kinase protein
MAAFTTPDEALSDLGQRLTPWFAGGSPGLVAPVVLGVRQASVTNGYSNETIICEVEHGSREARLTEKLVVRMPPSDAGHFDKYDMQHQYQVMDRLRRLAHISTPECRWIELDPAFVGRPFFMMTYVEGQVPPDAPQPYCDAGWVAEASAEQRATMWWSTVDALAKLALVDVNAADLAFLDVADRDRSRVAQIIERASAGRAWAAAGLPDIEIPHLDEIARLLTLNAPAEISDGLVWGDARLGNIIYRDFEPICLLDWELATIGDPIMDLSYFMMMDEFFRTGHGGHIASPSLTGFGSERETLAYYEKATGRSCANYGYFWALNAYIILCRCARYAALRVTEGKMTIEESSAFRKMPLLTAGALERISSDWR